MKKFKDISFQVRKNEILGLAGLIGAGKTELAKAIFGQERLEAGEIELEGGKISINSPLDAIHNGIVYITENRKEEGLFLDTSIKNNIVAPDLASVANHMGFISDQKINQISTQVIQQFNIKAYDADQITNTLSGGNQQKVLLGLWLHLKPKVLLVDEPTVGIDVESKTEIYKLLRKIADSGVAVIMISSEIKELLNNSDRIITMYKGTIIEEFIASQVSEKELLTSISGISNRE
ncbi:MAG: sugar ABC transporter ATP-binding protein [Clostridia bacterium]|nr:sugar ABC transporter ATP-binding protein [Clostridia bacterium]